jgi:hypothetical protein
MSRHTFGRSRAFEFGLYAAVALLAVDAVLWASLISAGSGLIWGATALATYLLGRRT